MDIIIRFTWNSDDLVTIEMITKFEAPGFKTDKYNYKERTTRNYCDSEMEYCIRNCYICPYSLKLAIVVARERVRCESHYTKIISLLRVQSRKLQTILTPPRGSAPGVGW